MGVTIEELVAELLAGPPAEFTPRRAAGVAGAALREEGHAADEATARRLREILRVAAVSGGEVWNRLRKGALLTEPRAGEELLDAALAIGPQAAAPPPLPSPLKGEG